MSERLEFKVKHDLSFDDAVEAVFRLLDIFDRGGEFEVIDWNEEENVGFVENEDVSISFTVDDNYLYVKAEIFNNSFHPEELRELLDRDINKAFEDVGSSPSRRRGLPFSKRSANKTPRTLPSSKSSAESFSVEERVSSEEKQVLSESTSAKREEKESNLLLWLILLVIIGAIAYFVFFVGF